MQIAGSNLVTIVQVWEMERVKNMTKKLMEERHKAEDRIADLEKQCEEMKLKLEEVNLADLSVYPKVTN